MFSRDGSLKSSNLFSAYNATWMGVTTALFMAAAAVFSYEPANTSSIIVPLNSFHWLSEVRLGLDKTSSPQNFEVAIPSIPSVSDVKVAAATLPAIHRAATHRLVALHKAHRRPRKHVFRGALDLAKASQPSSSTHGALAVNDQPLHIQSAHPIEVAPSPSEDEMKTEAQRLRGIHDLLQSRFLLAMSTDAVTTQVAEVTTHDTDAQAIEDAKANELITQRVVRIAKRRAKRQAEAKLAAQRKKLEAKKETRVSFNGDSASAAVVPAVEVKPVGTLAIQAQPTQQTPTPATTTDVSTMVDTLISHAAAPIEMVSITEPTPQVEEGQPAETAKMEQASPAGLDRVATNEDYQEPVTASNEAATQEVMGPAEATQVGSSESASVGMAIPGAVTTHSAVATAPLASATQPEYSATHPTNTDVAMNADVAKPSLDCGLFCMDGASLPNYVEAFNWGSALTGTYTEQLTAEGVNGRGWKTVRTADHWPTLHWSSDRGVPMVSSSSALILARRAGSPLQSAAGIVIVKVAAGWGAEFSGRAERPMVFDTKNQLVSTGQTDGERYYAFMNAAPGAHLMYVTKGAGSDGGAIAIPVQSGITTYADATVMNRRTLAGVVLDGEARSTHGISHVEVRVVGQSQATALSSETGTFRIDNVTVFSDHPVFVESEASTGYTHRYKLKQTEMNAVTLFRLSEKQVQDSIGQLEGGISPESGMVMAALPERILAKNVDASVRTLATNPTLRPETYSMSPDGQLSPQHHLSMAVGRFLSLQIPEGPAIAEALDSNHKAVWSELLVVSPGVVDLLMPN